MRLGGGRYALAMDSIAEVGRPPALTRVPGLPAWVAGVANWRGRVLPVLDLRPLLGATDTDLDRRSRLVVLAHSHPALGELRIGLLVEAVAGSAVTPGEIEPPLASLPPSVCALLRGQVTDIDGPYGVLDLDAIALLADDLPRARRTA